VPLLYLFSITSSLHLATSSFLRCDAKIWGSFPPSLAWDGHHRFRIVQLWRFISTNQLSDASPRVATDRGPGSRRKLSSRSMRSWAEAKPELLQGRRGLKRERGSRSKHQGVQEEDQAGKTAFGLSEVAGKGRQQEWHQGEIRLDEIGKTAEGRDESAGALGTRYFPTLTTHASRLVGGTPYCVRITSWSAL
jgi:hypothetical protein